MKRAEFVPPKFYREAAVFVKNCRKKSSKPDEPGIVKRVETWWDGPGIYSHHYEVVLVRQGHTGSPISLYVGEKDLVFNQEGRLP